MIRQTYALALAAMVVLLAPRASAADSLTFAVSGGNAGCTASDPASTTCACPAGPQMTCVGATCTLSGEVACSGGTITVQTGVTLAVTPWFSGATTEGTLTLRAAGGTIDIQSGAVIDADAAGYTGSAGIACSGAGCVCTATPGSNGNGFGPGFGVGGQCARDGAGGGAYGGFGGAGSSDTNCGAEVPAVAGGTPYDPDPNSVTLGSAGGAAGTSDNDNGGTGPSGGGAILLFAQDISISGTLTAHGGDGADPTTTHNDAQGGGAGGGILLNATAAISCSAGNSLDVGGGSGASADDKGGAGGGGRIKLFAVAVDGTCNFVTSAGSSGCSGGAGTAAVVTNGAIAAPVITSPPEGSTVGTATPTFGGTLAASVCALGAPSVRLMVDGAFLATTATVDCTTSPGSWSFTLPTGLSNGAHTIRAYAEVGAGGAALQSPPSADLHITVSAVAGTHAIAITVPAVNTHLNSALTQVSGTETGLDLAVVTVVATDSTGTATTLSAPTALLGAWSTGAISYIPAAQGTVTLTASATQGGTTYTDTRTYVFDTTGPAMNLTPTPNPSSAPNVQLDVTYSDPTSGVKPSTASLQVCDSDCTSNCTTVTVTPGASGFSASLGSPPLASGDGSYCAVATVEDLAGNTGSVSSHFSVDTTAPALSLNGGDPQQSPSGSVSGTETDANPGPVTVTWCALLPGQSCADMVTCSQAAQVGPLQPAADGSFSADPAALGGALAEGGYCVVTEATDLAGNDASIQTDLTVDRTGPTVSIDGNIPPTTTPRQVCISATDAQGIASIDVSWSLDGLAQGSLAASAQACAMTDGSPGNYTVTVPGGIDGQVQLAATATDTAGNPSAQATAGFLAVNSGPALVLYTPADPTNAVAPILYGSVTSPIAITAATLDVFEASGGSCTANMVATADVTSSASGFAVAPWTVTPLPPGEYCAQLTATDELGNTSTVTLLFTEDPTAPTLSIVVSPDPTVAAPPSATGVVGAGIADVQVSFSPVESDGTCSATAEQSGPAILNGASYSFTAAAALSHVGNCAPYCATAVGSDGAGNSYQAFTRFEDCTSQNANNGPMTLVVDPATDAAPVSASGTAPSNASSVQVTVTATDAFGNCTLDVVASGTATPSGGSWSVTTSPTLAAGNYCVTATAETGSAALAQAQAQVTVVATTSSSSSGASGAGSGSSGSTASGSSGSGSTSAAGTTTVGTGGETGSGSSGSGSTLSSGSGSTASSGSGSTASSGSGSTASSGSGSSASSGSGSSGSSATSSSSSGSGGSSSTVSSGSGSSGSSSASSSSSGSSGTSGSSGGSAAAGGTSGGIPGTLAGAGCGCGTTPEPGDTALLVLLFGGLLARRRRD